ncbi:hypothetical protein HGP14_10365 [Rhizobium sp. P32RR-XVIII]|uniref:CrpP-related protein n=1 Tax=Rhizobium sp. P32RR-XVIII TaxID=2726738 RepID=UPI001456F277|nr:CrpP-related protein [Rhizobium sp. P32RR-XVIII]NLS03759.1 hypothetical protein [Rhizobium sp. P32RR-XVIII]
MTIDEMVDLQKRGSRARVLGFKLSDNPYLHPERMLGHTAEALAEWLARYDAWKLGWETEHAIQAVNRRDAVPFEIERNRSRGAVFH